MSAEIETREIATVPTTTIKEPSHPLCELVDGDLLERARQPSLFEGYLRWQSVARGAAKLWVPGDPSPWHGYVIGLPPEKQEDTLQALGESIAQGLQRSAREYGRTSDRLLSVIQQDTSPTVRDTLALAPVFEHALVTMRTVGEEGITPFDTQEYSAWRTVYEQHLARLEEEMTHADYSQQMELFNKQRKLKEELRDRIRLLTSNSRPRSNIYRGFRQETAKRVGEVVAAEHDVFVIDPDTGLIQYKLPKIIVAGSPNPLPDDSPEWKIALQIGNIAGHPIARAIEQRQQEHRFSPRNW